MDSAFSRLSKVISLERKQGYRNKAVIGGLDKFASRWEPDAVREPRSPHVGEIVSLLIGYPAVEDTAARERIIEEILRRVRCQIAPTLAATEERVAPPPQARPAPLARLPPVRRLWPPNRHPPRPISQPSRKAHRRQNRLVRSRAESVSASAFCHQSANRRELRRGSRPLR